MCALTAITRSSKNIRRLSREGPRNRSIIWYKDSKVNSTR
jgi:hypothetical protein